MARRHLVENPAEVAAADLADLVGREALAQHLSDNRSEESSRQAWPGGVGRLAGAGRQNVAVGADADFAIRGFLPVRVSRLVWETIIGCVDTLSAPSTVSWLAGARSTTMPSRLHCNDEADFRFSRNTVEVPFR